MTETIYLLGSGFTKAALPRAPNNAELVAALLAHSGAASLLRKYQKKYQSDNVEVILTRLDLDAASQESIRLDRFSIERELVTYFQGFRFTTAALEAAPWLATFAKEVLDQDDAIITLNYDCFLDGLLDHLAVWTPNGGYYGVDNILIEASQNPKNILIYKIHGSEHFRVSAPCDRPEQDAIAFEFDGSIFPVSAANCHFGGGIDSRPYVIAPSFVKLPHRQIALMMLKLLEIVNKVTNLVITGCSLRREDTFLWLLLTYFLKRKDQKRLIIADPAAAVISERISQYWIGDICKYTQICLLPCGIESAVNSLSHTLKRG